MFSHQYTILCGHYGSGKTELSLHGALTQREAGRSVTLVDLDIVNPYFRSAEQTPLLEQAGVRVLKPTFAMTTVDIPSLPAQIQSVFRLPTEKVIFDVGGDETGSVALGRYAPDFARVDYAMLMVVNALRPFSSNVADICTMHDLIAARASLRPTALVSNTNFARATTADDVVRGHAIVCEAAQRLGLPVFGPVATADILSKLPAELRQTAQPLVRRMEPEWMQI